MKSVCVVNLLQEEVDPFGELGDENNVFVKIESNFDEEEHHIVGDTAYDTIAESADDQEILVDGIKSECVSKVPKVESRRAN